MNKKALFWNRVAKHLNYSIDKTSLKAIQLFAKYISKQDVILDFGCGQGTISCELAKKVKHVYGIDISTEMLKRATKNAEEKDIQNVSFTQTSVFEKSPIATTPNAILAFNVLQYIENLPELIARFHTILNKDGLFISSTACLAEKKTFSRFFMYFLMRIKVVPPTHFLQATELREIINKEGFEVIEHVLLSKMPDQLIIARKK